jgi:hypothetical protein
MYLSFVYLIKEAKIEVFIFLIVLTFILVFVILNALERRLHQKLSSKIEEKDVVFLEIDKLGVSAEPTDVVLDRLDQIARDFFEKEMGISKSLGYLQLVELFVQRNKTSAADFSNKMLYALYSGKKIDKSFANDLIFELEGLVNKEREEKRLAKLAKTQIQ